MNASVRLQEQLQALWTMAHLERLFDRSSVTIHSWRKTRGLPSVSVPGTQWASLRFVPEDVLTWARHEGIGYDLRAASDLQAAA